MRLYHYMPMRYVDVLCAEKTGLVPRTPLAHEMLSRYVDVPEGKYTFCFPGTPYPKNWVETGWLDQLVERTGEGLILEFEAPPSTLVLDATGLYAAVDRIRQVPFADDWDLESVIAKHAPELRSAFQEYWDSRVPLTEYRDDYFLHEAIIDVTIPFNEIARHSYIDTGF